MNEDFTVGDIYEGVSERLAEARACAAMGNRAEAQAAFKGAVAEYDRHKKILIGYPGWFALQLAVVQTQRAIERVSAT